MSSQSGVCPPPNPSRPLGLHPCRCSTNAQTTRRYINDFIAAFTRYSYAIHHLSSTTLLRDDACPRHLFIAVAAAHGVKTSHVIHCHLLINQKNPHPDGRCDRLNCAPQRYAVLLVLQDTCWKRGEGPYASRDWLLILSWSVSPPGHRRAEE